MFGKAILDQYVKTTPSPQNALDIFAGEWSSVMPQDNGNLVAGQAELFADARITWAAEQTNGFAGKRVLELGPLEGGHSYMLQQMGAAEVVAIESNSRAYLKCLITKELFNLHRCRFLLGDFVEYLKETTETYDICLASGVLYHMREPGELLALIAKVSRTAIIWTHYYDPAIIKAKWKLRRNFSSSTVMNAHGFQYTAHKQHYRAALGWGGFCGGSAHYSYWMTYEDIMAGLRYFGFKRIETSFHQTDHPNGPALCLVCEK